MEHTNLQDLIDNIGDGSLTEEQAWALCYKATKHFQLSLNVKDHLDSIADFDLGLTKTGEIYQRKVSMEGYANDKPNDDDRGRMETPTGPSPIPIDPSKPAGDYNTSIVSGQQESHHGSVKPTLPPPVVPSKNWLCAGSGYNAVKISRWGNRNRSGSKSPPLPPKIPDETKGKVMDDPDLYTVPGSDVSDYGRLCPVSGDPGQPQENTDYTQSKGAKAGYDVTQHQEFLTLEGAAVSKKAVSLRPAWMGFGNQWAAPPSSCLQSSVDVQRNLSLPTLDTHQPLATNQTTLRGGVSSNVVSSDGSSATRTQVSDLVANNQGTVANTETSKKDPQQQLEHRPTALSASSTPTLAENRRRSVKDQAAYFSQLSDDVVLETRPWMVEKATLFDKTQKSPQSVKEKAAVFGPSLWPERSPENEQNLETELMYSLGQVLRQATDTRSTTEQEWSSEFKSLIVNLSGIKKHRPKPTFQDILTVCSMRLEDTTDSDLHYSTVLRNWTAQYEEDHSCLNQPSPVIEGDATSSGGSSKQNTNAEDTCADSKVQDTSEEATYPVKDSNAQDISEGVPVFRNLFDFAKKTDANVLDIQDNNDLPDKYDETDSSPISTSNATSGEVSSQVFGSTRSDAADVMETLLRKTEEMVSYSVLDNCEKHTSLAHIYDNNLASPETPPKMDSEVSSSPPETVSEAQKRPSLETIPLPETDLEVVKHVLNTDSEKELSLLDMGVELQKRPINGSSSEQQTTPPPDTDQEETKSRPPNTDLEETESSPPVMALNERETPLQEDNISLVGISSDDKTKQASESNPEEMKRPAQNRGTEDKGPPSETGSEDPETSSEDKGPPSEIGSEDPETGSEDKGPPPDIGFEDKGPLPETGSEAIGPLSETGSEEPEIRPEDKGPPSETGSEDPETGSEDKGPHPETGSEGPPPDMESKQNLQSAVEEEIHRMFEMYKPPLLIGEEIGSLQGNVDNLPSNLPAHPENPNSILPADIKDSYPKLPFHPEKADSNSQDDPDNLKLPADPENCNSTLSADITNSNPPTDETIKNDLVSSETVGDRENYGASKLDSATAVNKPELMPRRKRGPPVLPKPTRTRRRHGKNRNNLKPQSSLQTEERDSGANVPPKHDTILTSTDQASPNTVSPRTIKWGSVSESWEAKLNVNELKTNMGIEDKSEWSPPNYKITTKTTVEDTLETCQNGGSKSEEQDECLMVETPTEIPVQVHWGNVTELWSAALSVQQVKETIGIKEEPLTTPKRFTSPVIQSPNTSDDEFKDFSSDDGDVNLTDNTSPREKSSPEWCESIAVTEARLWLKLSQMKETMSRLERQIESDRAERLQLRSDIETHYDIFDVQMGITPSDNGDIMDGADMTPFKDYVDGNTDANRETRKTGPGCTKNSETQRLSYLLTKQEMEKAMAAMCHEISRRKAVNSESDSDSSVISSIADSLEGSTVSAAQPGTIENEDSSFVNWLLSVALSYLTVSQWRLTKYLAASEQNNVQLSETKSALETTDTVPNMENLEEEKIESATALSDSRNMGVSATTLHTTSTTLSDIAPSSPEGIESWRSLIEPSSPLRDATDSTPKDTHPNVSHQSDVDTQQKDVTLATTIYNKVLSVMRLSRLSKCLVAATQLGVVSLITYCSVNHLFSADEMIALAMFYIHLMQDFTVRSLANLLALFLGVDLFSNLDFYAYLTCLPHNISMSGIQACLPDIPAYMASIQAHMPDIQAYVTGAFDTERFCNITGLCSAPT